MFLGVGIHAAEPTWGNMIYAGRPRPADDPAPRVRARRSVMFLTVFALNRVGDWARSKWDPRQSNL